MFFFQSRNLSPSPAPRPSKTSGSVAAAQHPRSRSSGRPEPETAAAAGRVKIKSLQKKPSLTVQAAPSILDKIKLFDSNVSTVGVATQRFNAPNKIPPSKSTPDLSAKAGPVVGHNRGRRLTLGPSSPTGVIYPPASVTKLAAEFNRMDEVAKMEVMAVRKVSRINIARTLSMPQTEFLPINNYDDDSSEGEEEEEDASPYR